MLDWFILEAELLTPRTLVVLEFLLVRVAPIDPEFVDVRLFMRCACGLNGDGDAFFCSFELITLFSRPKLF